MRHKKIVHTTVFLLLIIFCCVYATAETYDFGGTTDNGVYSGTLAVDNNGNVAFTVAAATGPGADVQVTAQYSDDTGGAAAGQETRAVGESAFIGSGAASSNGDTASTGAHAIGNADIDTLQAAEAGQGGVPGFATVDGALAIQETTILGQNAAAGSLGVSHAGYEADTNTHANDGGMETFQGSGAGEINFLGIDVAGAVAAQHSLIDSENGGSASSTATGGVNSAETQLSFSDDGLAETYQGAAVGQVSIVGLPGVTIDGAVAGQESLINSVNGGTASSSASNGNGYEAGTEANFNGEGLIAGGQIAAAGNVEGTLFSTPFDAGGVLAGQTLTVISDNGGYASSSANTGNSYETFSISEYAGNGAIGTTQGAAAVGIEIPGTATVDGAVSGQISVIESDIEGTAFTYTGSSDFETGAVSIAEFGYDGGIMWAVQGGAAGQVDLTGVAAVDGAVVGQYAEIDPDGTGTGFALVAAQTGNDYDLVSVQTVSTGGNPIDDVIQGAAAGRISVTNLITFDAEGAAAFQHSSLPAGNIMFAEARHGTTHAADPTNSPDTQYALAGRATGFGGGAFAWNS